MDDNVSIDDVGRYRFFRCVKCYKIIALSPSKLDDDGNLFSWDYDGKHHKCFGYDIIEKTDDLTLNRLTEELFLNILRHKYLDEKTGLVKSTYEARVKILYYVPDPVFILHLSHIEDNKIKQELAELADDQKTLDDVMRDAIGKALFIDEISISMYNQ